MDDNGELTSLDTGRWTRAEDYIQSLLRLRRARRAHLPPPRTEPETPRFSLSTLPFLALLAGLGVMAVAIAIAAWPGNQPPPVVYAAVQAERGVAPPGWFEDAKREMHHPPARN
jgi:hypothetical protein